MSNDHGCQIPRRRTSDPTYNIPCASYRHSMDSTQVAYASVSKYHACAGTGSAGTVLRAVVHQSVHSLFEALHPEGVLLTTMAYRGPG